ncbi:MAG: hypothetical protein L3J83_01880 [Proteobacteria bacterium]|nr:hypothetical protein [Pseudomonadota bacterium]
MLPAENYHQTLQRFVTLYTEEEPTNQNGKDLKKALDIIKTISKKQRIFRNLIKRTNKQLKQPNLTSREKSILRKEINKYRKEIRAVNIPYQETFRRMLLSSQSPDVAILILYQYKNRLPEYWYNRLIKKLSGLPNKELNRYVENKYFDYLIHPAMDLYVCALGYPCDEQAYLMYFQCLGMKYKANINACNKPVYQYYLSDFLTENMQYDVFKLLSFFGGYKP